MPNYSSPRFARIFAQIQPGSPPAIGTVANSSGVWTSTGAALIRADEGASQFNFNAPYNRVPVLTGTRSNLLGTRGRKLANWTLGVPVIPSGVAGTAPDADPLYMALFGAKTVSAGVSVTYSFLDTAFNILTLLKFQHGVTTTSSQYIWGCMPTRATFRFNENFFICEFSGDAGGRVDSNAFSVYDAITKAGLTAFPIEPASPTTNGNPIPGFGTGCTLVVHGQSLEMVTTSLSLELVPGNEAKNDVFGSPYISAWLGGPRDAMLQFSVIDSDAATLTDIKQQAETDGSSVNAVITLGSVAGSKISITANNLQLPSYSLTDSGNRVEAVVPQAAAHATAIGSVDDMTFAFL